MNIDNLNDLAELVLNVQPDKRMRAEISKALLEAAGELDALQTRAEDASNKVHEQQQELRRLRAIREAALVAQDALDRGLR